MLTGALPTGGAPFLKKGGEIQSWSRAMGCLLALGATAVTKMVSLHNKVNNGSKYSG